MSLYPEDVPFEVIKEKWCTYDLGNGCTLKTKIVLGKIMKPPDIPLERTKEWNFQTKPHFIVYTPIELKGTPETRPLTSQIMEESIIEDVDPTPIETNINEYRLENDTIIRLRLMLTRVALTDKYTADGSPVYVINHQIVPQILLPKPVRSRRRSGPNVV